MWRVIQQVFERVMYKASGSKHVGFQLFLILHRNAQGNSLGTAPLLDSLYNKTANNQEKCRRYRELSDSKEV